MIKDSIAVQKNYTTYTDKIMVTEDQKTTMEPLFNNPEETNNEKPISETEEKIIEIENRLTELNTKGKERRNNRIITGVVTSLFSCSAIAGHIAENDTPLHEMGTLMKTIEKTSRSIRHPIKNYLFFIGVCLAGIATISTVLSSLFVLIGKNNDKIEANNLEKELIAEKAKLAQLKSEFSK